MSRTRDVTRGRWPWLAVISLGAMLGCLSMAHAESAPTPPSGLTALAQPAAMPSFKLPTTNGDTLDSASLAGQVVIVRFWATWWTICQSEMPSVQRAHDAAKGRDVVMLAISLDGGGLPAVKRFLDKKGYTLPALVDPDMTIARAFGARGVPSTFIVDRKGMVVAQGGSLDVDSPDMKAYIDGLLKEPKG